MAGAFLAGCGETTPVAVATGAPVSALPVATTPAPATAAPLAPPASPPPTARVAVTPVKEPNDQAHRDYCGSGATQVLVSAWLPTVPDIETVARLSKLDPNRGQTGANTVIAINHLLAAVAQPALGGDFYTGRHTDRLADVVAALRADLPNPRTQSVLGHGAPIMVQTMTRNLPGWNHWQATHMITIFAYDLRSGDPATETVTYAETPSPQAAYTGPPVQTIPLSLLWSEMQSYTAIARDDPINLIS